jgi:hypothetical protein
MAPKFVIYLDVKQCQSDNSDDECAHVNAHVNVPASKITANLQIHHGRTHLCLHAKEGKHYMLFHTAMKTTKALTYSLTYLLTPWSIVLLEKLTGLQLVKKFPAFYGTRRFITTCPYPQPAQSSPHTHIPLPVRSILIPWLLLL